MENTAFFNKLTFHARHALKEARALAVFTKKDSVLAEHLLLALFLENGSLGTSLLQGMGFDRERLSHICLKKDLSLKRKPEDQTRLVTLGDSVKKIIEKAFNIASQFQSPYVGTEHFIYALLEVEDSALDEIFIELEIDEKKIESTLSNHMGFDKIPDFSRLFDMPDSLQRDSLGQKNRSADQGPHPYLSQYAINLTHPKNTPDHPLSGREEELIRLTQILARKQKSNPLLLGEPGVGKTALVSALAEKIKRRDVPPQLIGKHIYALDLALLVAGTNFRGEFEARFKEVIREATATKDVILFIDEIHTLVGAGNTSGGLDAANILKPALARGEIQCIGATTETEFKRHIEKDAALERRFQIVRIEEPSVELTHTMLLSAKKSYEEHHQIEIPTTLLPEIIQLSTRYINDRFLPDKAFDILDEASTLVRQRNKEDASTRKKHALIQQAEEARNIKASLIENSAYEEAEVWHKRIATLEKQLSRLEAKSTKTEPLSFAQLERKHILETVSRMSGVPLPKLTHPRPKIRLNQLRRALRKEIIGQPQALEVLDQIFVRSLAELDNKHRPLGSLLFLGPTGVGKTLTAKIIAQEFFGNEKSLIRLDMSEFMERHSTAQILGAPAGYVGYGEGGKLTEQVRKKPFSVILFDEIEKAHPDIFNLLLQILDEGYLTDAEGRKVNFRHCLIILTSNIGTQTFAQEGTFGFAEKEGFTQVSEPFEAQKNKVLSELKKQLRPELLARLDHIVVFDPLNTKSLLSIINTELKKLAEKLREKEISLTYTQDVPLYLLDTLKAEKEGARLIRKNIAKYIENILAHHILEYPEAKAFALSLTNDTLVCQKQK